MKKLAWIVVAICLAATTGCGNHTSYRIAPQEVHEVNISRFDSLLVAYDALADTSAQHAIVQEASPFPDIYCRHILGLADAPLYREGVHAFLHDSTISQLYVDTQQAFADITAEEQALAQVVARYKMLFPTRPTPVLQTHISGLNQQIVTVDSLVSISIDCYLGADYPLYAQRYNSYERPLHNRERLVPDVAEVLLHNALPATQITTLLDAMVHEGKVLYLLATLLDDNNATRLMGYTAAQVAWCEHNEASIWRAIVGNDHLYATDAMTLRKYIAPAPFTAPVSQDAPGRIGRWVGWRMVEQYAQQCRLTPQQLAADTTAAGDILRLSRYDGK